MADSWTFCVAPMLDWTDRHCRFFHRLLTRRARLYTEMVTTGALMHGDVARHLAHAREERPLALQVGGSDPGELAHVARLGERWGYDEINLNCGCPSERVQRGSFGACLMAEPALVRDGVRAMCDAVTIPVTVKHRIGVDRRDDYGFVRDFVGEVARGGARVFIVHARSAWLQGLSPKQNREVPPLRYDYAQRLKRDFPALTIVLNGGLRTMEQACDALRTLDGVMVGREAYQNPWWLTQVDRTLYGDDTDAPAREEIVERLVAYARTQCALGVPLRHVTRHVLGLYNGLPGARRWRRMLSDPQALAANDASLIARAAREIGAAHTGADEAVPTQPAGGVPPQGARPPRAVHA